MHDRLARAAFVLWAIAALGGCAALPPDLDAAATAHLPARVELAQVPFYPQQEYQCGPAALATVLTAAGAPTTSEQLVDSVFLPGRRGSLQVELLAAARMRERVPYVLPERLTAILEQIAAGRPVLVMQNLGITIAPLWHFAVVVGYDLDAGELILRSGTTQRLTMSTRRFVRAWDRAQRWAFVALAPDEAPADPDRDRYLAAIAAMESIGKLDAAASAYARASQIWPDSAWPRLGLANIAYARQDLHAAEQGYRAALALDGGNVVAHNNLAQILLTRGCRSQARRHALRAAELAAGTSLAPAVAATLREIESPAGSGVAVPQCEPAASTSTPSAPRA
ncbi:MAG TPA: PA2778 family cysteine peptidase [Steroidobacter sp.]|nr:PA2778 family cysteine peptidase [Steroidobacter sp.]